MKIVTNPNFNFKDCKIFVIMHDKQHRKIIESIITSNSIKQKPGVFNLSIC